MRFTRHRSILARAIHLPATAGFKQLLAAGLFTAIAAQGNAQDIGAGVDLFNAQTFFEPCDIAINELFAFGGCHC